MSRGVFSGLVAGAAVSVLALGAASLMAPLPETGAKLPMAAPAEPAAEGTQDSTPPVEAPAAPALDEASAPDAAPTAPAKEMPQPAESPTAEAVELPPGSEFNRPPPEAEARLPGTDGAVAEPTTPEVPAPAPSETPVVDTSPAPAPEAGQAPGGLGAPEVQETAPGVVSPEDPAFPSPESVSPTVPPSETLPQRPDPAPAAKTETPTAPMQPEDTADADAGSAPPPAMATVEEPETPAAEETIPDTPPVAAATLPEGGALRVPAPGGGIAKPDVRTGRLPSIGDDDPGAEASDAAAPEPATLGALSRNAVAFTPEEGKPIYSVVLIDAGPDGLDRATLTTFSFPVTFAVDATRPDAVEAMQTYRAAGFEVVLITGGLPQGAQPQDLETAFGIYLGDLPEAVAIMDSETGGVGNDRALLQQLASVLVESGHGFLSFDKGLNTASKIAQSEGVPTATVFRKLDDGRESVPTIRRYLDRAAFKAAQDGAVVMLGHSYPETVTALFSWALEGKGADVNLAPVSAILRQR